MAALRNRISPSDQSRLQRASAAPMLSGLSPGSRPGCACPGQRENLRRGAAFRQHMLLSTAFNQRCSGDGAVRFFLTVSISNSGATFYHKLCLMWIIGWKFLKPINRYEVWQIELIYEKENVRWSCKMTIYWKQTQSLTKRSCHVLHILCRSLFYTNVSIHLVKWTFYTNILQT